MKHIIPKDTAAPVHATAVTCPNGDCPGYRVTFPADTARAVCPWSGDPLEVAEHGGSALVLPVPAQLVDQLAAAELAALVASTDALVAARVFARETRPAAPSVLDGVPLSRAEVARLVLELDSRSADRALTLFSGAGAGEGYEAARAAHEAAHRALCDVLDRLFLELARVSAAGALR